MKPRALFAIPPCAQNPNTNTNLYSRGMHPVARVIKSQDKTFVRNNQQNVLYFVLSMITTCFGLRKRPSSGDYHVTQTIKKKVTVRYNGSLGQIVR
jgi:hypothetical protein